MDQARTQGTTIEPDKHALEHVQCMSNWRKSCANTCANTYIDMCMNMCMKVCINMCMTRNMDRNMQPDLCLLLKDGRAADGICIIKVTTAFVVVTYI